MRYLGDPLYGQPRWINGFACRLIESTIPHLAIIQVGGVGYLVMDWRTCQKVFWQLFYNPHLDPIGQLMPRFIEPSYVYAPYIPVKYPKNIC